VRVSDLPPQPTRALSARQPTSTAEPERTMPTPWAGHRVIEWCVRGRCRILGGAVRAFCTWVGSFID
jgi:hypothetical protein